jgi:cysteine desulfurase/selenocysteine lyase
MTTTSFSYIDQEIIYLDSACQSLRPETVIRTEIDYYVQSNACAGRSNHAWGEAVDKQVGQTRQKILEYLGKPKDEYVVVFGPNATYGINLILQSIPKKSIKSVITTNKEHNSVFLPAQTLAKQAEVPLHILERELNGSIRLESIEKLYQGVAIFNDVSNIDGQLMPNLSNFCRELNRRDNLVMIDATQSLGHFKSHLLEIDFDCLFASGHKLYGPSLGFLVIKKDLVRKLDQTWVGGGTVQKVTRESYELINADSELHARLELGLMDYAAIFGLHQALHWLQNFKVKTEFPSIQFESNMLDKLKDRLSKTGPSREAWYYIEGLSELLLKYMKEMESVGKIKLIRDNSEVATSIISFIPINMDSYDLASKLSANKIMVRSGYLCCHYYLKNVLGLPAVTRLSLGLHNTPQDISFLLHKLYELL